MASKIQSRLARNVSRAEWTSIQRFRCVHYAAMFERPNHVAVARFVGETGLKEMRSPKLTSKQTGTLWRPAIFQLDAAVGEPGRGILRSATLAASIGVYLERLRPGTYLPKNRHTAILELAADSFDDTMKLIDYHEQTNPEARFSAFVLSAADITIKALEETGFKVFDKTEPTYVTELGEAHNQQLALLEFSKPAAV